MAMKVYQTGEKVAIEKDANPIFFIPVTFASIRINGDVVTVFSILDATVSEFDTVANIQDSGGTPIGNLTDVVKYLNGFIFSGSTTSVPEAATSGTAVETASNVGTGEGVFKQKTGVDLEFKTLLGGTNVTITNNANDLTIDASGGSSPEQFYLDRVETIDNATATSIEYFTEVQGGTEISNVINVTGGTYWSEWSFICLNTSKSGRVVVDLQVNSVDVFSQSFRREPKDNDEIFYISISKQITLSSGNNTIQIQLSNDGSGTGRIFEANAQITKV